MDYKSELKGIDKNIAEVGEAMKNQEKKNNYMGDAARVVSEYRQKLESITGQAKELAKKYPKAKDLMAKKLAAINAKFDQLEAKFNAGKRSELLQVNSLKKGLNSLFATFTKDVKSQMEKGNIKPAKQPALSGKPAAKPTEKEQLLKAVNPDTIRKQVEQNLVLTSFYNELKSVLKIIGNDPAMKQKQAYLEGESKILDTYQRIVTDKTRKNDTYLNKNTRKEALYQYSQVLKRLFAETSNVSLEGSSQRILKSIADHAKRYTNADYVWTKINKVKAVPQLPQNDVLDPKTRVNKAPRQKVAPVVKNIVPKTPPKVSSTPSATPSNTPTTPQKTPEAQLQTIDRVKGTLDTIKKKHGLNIEPSDIKKAINENTKEAQQARDALSTFFAQYDNFYGKESLDNLKKTLAANNVELRLSQASETPFAALKIDKEKGITKNIIRINPFKIQAGDQRKFEGAVNIFNH